MSYKVVNGWLNHGLKLINEDFFFYFFFYPYGKKINEKKKIVFWNQGHLKSSWVLLNSIIKINSKYYNEHDTFRTRDKYINLSSSMLFYLNADGGRPSCAREDDSPKSCRCFSWGVKGRCVARVLRERRASDTISALVCLLRPVLV